MLSGLLQQWAALMASLAPGVQPAAVEVQVQQQSSQPGSIGISISVTEVVEVKHTCPFDAR